MTATHNAVEPQATPDAACQTKTAPSRRKAPAPPITAPRQWLTHEVAEAARWHPESIRRAIRQGRIQVIRFGRSLRIADSEAQRILTQGL
jgi:hypothetical protein